MHLVAQSQSAEMMLFDHDVGVRLDGLRLLERAPMLHTGAPGPWVDIRLAMGRLKHTVAVPAL